MSKVSIVIPVYYNEGNLLATYMALKEKVLNLVDEYELIFVDDGSGDNSYQILSNLKNTDNHIKLIKLSRNFGSHSAILAGLDHATGDCVTVISADLQDDPNSILQMFDKWRLGVSKVVLAVREGREEGFLQKSLSNLYYKIFRSIAIKDMPENGFDCFLLDKQVINVLKQLEEKNSTIMGQVLWCGFSRDIIYYTRKAREIGKSRWTLSKKIKLFIDSILSFSYFPIRMVSITGLIVFVISLIMSIILILEKMMGRITIQGWTSLAILQLFMFGVQMLVMGLLGEYLWRTLDTSRKRPIYIIEEIKE